MDEDPLGSDRRSVLRRRVERSLTPLRPRLSAVRRRGLPHLPRPDHELAATGGAVRLRQDVVRRLHGADRLRRPQQRRVGAVRAGAGAAGGLPGALRHHQRDARRFAQPADTARRPRRSVKPGDRVKLASGGTINLKADTLVENQQCADVKCPPLGDTGVPFAYVDQDVRNFFSYFYAVTAFDVNSLKSWPTALQSPHVTKRVSPRRAGTG